MNRMKLGLYLALFLLVTAPVLAHSGHSEGPHPNETGVTAQGNPMLPGLLLVATVVGFVVVLVLLAYYVRRRDIEPELAEGNGSLTAYKDQDTTEATPTGDDEEDDTDGDAT